MTRADQLARNWLAQAQNDFLFAQSALRERFYAQCCFICQQVAEKALKAILLQRKQTLIFTHSTRELCRVLRINGALLKAASYLDQYYVTGRYPNALPGGVPFASFHVDQAKGAVRDANLFLKKARSLVRTKSPAQRTSKKR